MADAKIDMALDDIIKKNRNGPGNRRGRGRGRGGNLNQRRGGGGIAGRITKTTNNNRGRGGNFQRGGGGGRNSFNQRNNNRSTNFRQQRGRGNTIPGFNRRGTNGDKPTATYNPLSRDNNVAASKQQRQPQIQTTPRRQQGSIFNKIRPNQNVSALRRRMVAAQRALTRATKTLAEIPRMRQQRQRILQQPQKLRNIITRNKLGGRGGIRKRLTNARKPIGRGGARRIITTAIKINVSNKPQDLFFFDNSRLRSTNRFLFGPNNVEFSFIEHAESHSTETRCMYSRINIDQSPTNNLSNIEPDRDFS
ncbi:unnamed protein product [Rotaria magnacalcarata]|uniref:Uncharacterized protein n=1 Tax=Rotaria magnacalcarata TaxID=392030 RepID=A0A819MT96_9BILA|nr:unnamed protein product [Rotaria magnacalcarata]CAF4041683.1 unnamed protein product [Rotaria magnacalcarata]